MSKHKVVFFRTPYNYDVEAASNESAIQCDDPSLAEQNFREQSDINYIANLLKW